jgi:hypothetical protein
VPEYNFLMLPAKSKIDRILAIGGSPICSNLITVVEYIRTEFDYLIKEMIADLIKILHFFHSSKDTCDPSPVLHKLVYKQALPRDP